MSTGVTAAKLFPPAVPAPLILRPALERRLDEAFERRLVLLTAGAGLGKSALLSSWAADRSIAWYTLSREDADLGSLVRGIVGAVRIRVPDLPPDFAAVGDSRGPGAEVDELGRADAYAGLLCAALEERLGRDLVLVLDDVHEIAAGRASCRLVEGLCRQSPPAFHVVLSSRAEPPFAIERLRGQGQVLELTAGDLAFSPEETTELLVGALGDGTTELAGLVHEATGGWPAGVRLALEALRGVSAADGRRTVEGLRRPGSPLFAYLAGEVFDQEDPEVRELVRTVAPLERFTAELCTALGVAGAAETLGLLRKRDVFVEPDRAAAGWFRLSELAREFALERLDLSSSEVADLRRRAAVWLEANGHVGEALGLLAAVADEAAIARLLAERGEAMLSAGEVETVVRAADLLPPELRSAAVERLAGHARQIHGDWEGALACFERATAGAERLDAAVAWRMGLIHHLRGELDEALAVYARGRLGTGEPKDDALLLAWHATVDWLRSDVEGCRAKVERAFEIATAAGDPRALAAAHTVLAMLAALEGDRAANDAHYVRALEHAERAGDVLQIIRVRTNRGSRHVEEGAYEEAIAELELALRLADLAGFAFFRALALSNRGEARLRLGRFEEAIRDLEAAKATYQRMGSRDVSYPLCYLGEIYRKRGDLALARAAYEEAVAQLEDAGDLQGLVPALGGLARVLAGEEDDAAWEHAERAIGYGPGMGHVESLLAGATVALSRRERGKAVQLAEEAAAVARARRDRAGLAEALELGALASSDPGDAAERLEQALAIWRDVRDPLGEARAQLRLARIVGPLRGRELAAEAEKRLRALGARRDAAAAAALRAEWSEQQAPAVSIECLGRFRVLRRGDAVSSGEWQSRKARDLLKLLVARRGRPVPREAVMEALWPEGDPAKVANRLSVALSTIRAVLDPERRHDPERFLRADRDVVALDLDAVDVDVEGFLAEAAAGLDLVRAGGREKGRERLAAAEARYTGDFLEEDAYADWAVALREEARATYIRVARALAQEALAGGDHDAAARYFLRTLERDGYDEAAHLALVSTLQAAGRHGEARRAFRVYAARMEEIGVESAPFPPAARRVASP